MLKILNSSSRYIVATIFILSGFVKLIDPFGTAYKIGDYTESIHINLPLWLALGGSLMLSFTEFILGLNAFFKVNYKRTTKLIFYIISFFFILTLIIAITDPVQDCGCFGDALVISNWATFFKNVVLLALSWIMLRNNNFYHSKLTPHRQTIATLCFIAFGALISINAIQHLPFIDFRPFSVGTHIPDKMQIPNGKPTDVYQTTFIYEKDGIQQEFTQENYPWQDTTWSYVNSESILIKKGYEPPIHDFSIEHPEWGDITEEVLQDDNYTFMLISPRLEKASLKHLEEIENLAQYAEKMGYRFLVITATVGDGIQTFTEQFTTPLQVCIMDEITLKTMIRANPGLIILKDGVILEKYHHNDLPTWDAETNISSAILSHQESQKTRIIVLLLAFVLGTFAFKLTNSKN